MGWLRDYSMDRLYEAEWEIESMTDDEILAIERTELTQFYLRKFGLPLIVRDNSKPVAKMLQPSRSLREDDDEVSIRRWTRLAIHYYFERNDRLEELFRNSRFRATEFVMHLHYADGEVVFFADEKYAESALKNFEDAIDDVNDSIEEGNRFLEENLKRFIENFKKAVEQDRSKPLRLHPPDSLDKNKDEDNDFDDEGHSRSPNDDRSDTLNPNNPAYDDARDNRSDQLNPNNPRHQETGTLV